MNEPTPQDLLAKLSEIAELSPDIRFGQMLANIGFLAEARAGQSIWDIEAAALLEIMEEHRLELCRRVQAAN